MQQGTKIAVVVLAIALVAVIGLICLTKGSGTAQPITEATATPAAEQTSMPEETPQPEEGAGVELFCPPSFVHFAYSLTEPFT